jgi:hypothetical protein
MSGKRIVFIPFEGGVGADSSIGKTVASFTAKYQACRVVAWPEGASQAWSKDDQSARHGASPLGKDVDVNEDVIIIVGHGNYSHAAISVKTETKKAGLTLTDSQRENSHHWEGSGQIILQAAEVAARLIYMGLRSDHKYIKTTSCCGVGIGEFDPGENKLNVDNILNDKYPHTFARDLAKALGKTHKQIRVGGYPGYVDCTVKEKMVSWHVPKDKDDATETKWEKKDSPWGGKSWFADSSKPEREPFNRWKLEPYTEKLGGRLVMVPVKVCPECRKPDGHEPNCSKSQLLRKNFERIVPVIWYDHGGRALHGKREGTLAGLPDGFSRQKVTSADLLPAHLPKPR